MGATAGTPHVDHHTRTALGDPPKYTGRYVGRGEFYSGIQLGDRVFVRVGDHPTIQSMDAGAHLYVTDADVTDFRPASCLERDRYAVAILEGVVRRRHPAATDWERNEVGRVERRLAADVCAPTDLRDRIHAVRAAIEARCTCTWADDEGNLEVGPDPYIAAPDEACPLHGRGADPQAWAEMDDADAAWYAAHRAPVDAPPGDAPDGMPTLAPAVTFEEADRR